jgi:bacterioferritin
MLLRIPLLHHAVGHDPDNYFLKDVAALRESTKIYLEKCPTVRSVEDEAQISVELLQTVLAAEIVCVLRYTSISVSTAGLKNGRVGAEFQEQANDERRHMTMAAQRIEELGGTPNFAPENLLSRTATAFEDDRSLSSIVEQNLLAEQSVVEHYRELIGFFSKSDPTTCLMLESILQDEENHAADMQDLLVPGNEQHRSH